MLTITSTGEVVPRTQRVLTDALKAAAIATVEHWHERYLPRHFTEEGFALYNYQPRKGQDEPSLLYGERGRAVRQGKRGRLVNNPHYYWRKWRTRRTHDPLVYSGESKRRAESSIRLNAQAVNGGTTIRGTGVMDLPRYFYQYDPAKGAPDKADELLRTTPSEEAELTAFYNSAVSARLAASAPAPAAGRVA